MTILESLLVINTFPIPDNAIIKICLDRELNHTADYAKSIGDSDAYKLATADVYFWLFGHPSIVEQEVGINNAIAIKQKFYELAMNIYGEFNDPKFSGEEYGFIGENWND